MTMHDHLRVLKYISLCLVVFLFLSASFWKYFTHASCYLYRMLKQTLKSGKIVRLSCFYFLVPTVSKVPDSLHFSLSFLNSESFLSPFSSLRTYRDLIISTLDYYLSNCSWQYHQNLHCDYHCRHYYQQHSHCNHGTTTTTIITVTMPPNTGNSKNTSIIIIATIYCYLLSLPPVYQSYHYLCHIKH